MERVIKTLIERAAGRTVCIYGAGETGETTFRILKSEGLDVAFFIDRNWQCLNGLCKLPVYSAEKLDCTCHFVVLSNSTNLIAVDGMKDTLISLGYKKGEWFYWYEDVDYDVVLNGVAIGKGTPIFDMYLKPQAHKRIASVGRFSAIHSTLHVNNSHFIGLSSSHLVPNDDILYRKHVVYNPLEIGHDVYIGVNVFINQSKVKKIGNGAIIGAGAIVLEDVPPYSIVTGVPGKIKKYRFTPEQVDILEQVCWWDWDDETMKANSDCFVNPKLFFERFGKTI